MIDTPKKKQRCLLLNRSFYPLFWVQFLGAFNDNLYKNAMVMLITFKLTNSAVDTGLLITLAAGLFILPFFIFSAFAGQIADRYPKSVLIKKIKLAEILIMLIGGLALLSQNLWLLFITLFLMGTQSAFFGPIKYSILPEILDEKRLIKGNGLFSGSTFIAILIGTILGGLGVLLDGGLWIMASLVILVSVIGYLFSLLIAESKQFDKQLVINWNRFSSTYQVVKESHTHKTAFFSVLAISWFWFIGAVMLSQIPALVKYDLYANDKVVMLFLTLFSVGIAIGSGLVGKLMPVHATIKWHWGMILGMSAMLLLTVWSIFAIHSGVVHEQNVSHETLLTIAQFITLWPANLSLVFLFILAVLGGMYIVPLYTILQTHTPIAVRARIVAVNNIVNALLMVVSAILIMLGFAFSLSLLEMFSILAFLNVFVAIVLYRNRLKASEPWS
ncbi:MFS transporter [Thiomicrorhabdus sp.]|uniref:MFS transporter n=1 Tax=Thiomicrorhabdus sp. TaxID=2039724 RepID=UPI002AA80908|nr:MFS transporter [Thiomicrorhabdus sp.]